MASQAQLLLPSKPSCPWLAGAKAVLCPGPGAASYLGSPLRARQATGYRAGAGCAARLASVVGRRAGAATGLVVTLGEQGLQLNYLQDS